MESYFEKMWKNKAVLSKVSQWGDLTYFFTIPDSFGDIFLKPLTCLLLLPWMLFSKQIPDYFSIGSGAFDCYRPKWRAKELEIEYKPHFNWLKSPFHFLEFRPLIGVMANERGSGYLYLGLNLDLLFFDHLHFAPGFAGGYYWQGRGKNLGYPIEFRSGIELAWQFASYHRLGVHFYHLSNASIGTRNPGEESLILFYDIPIKSWLPFNNN